VSHTFFGETNSLLERQRHQTLCAILQGNNVGI
jgi:hypothetical protein